MFMIGKLNPGTFPPLAENLGWAPTALQAFEIVRDSYSDGTYHVQGHGVLHEVVRKDGAITVDGRPLTIG